MIPVGYLLASTMLTPANLMHRQPIVQRTHRAMKQHAANQRTTDPVRWEWFDRWRAMQAALVPSPQQLAWNAQEKAAILGAAARQDPFPQFGVGPLVRTVWIDRR